MANQYQPMIDSMAKIYENHWMLGGRVEVAWLDYERIYGSQFENLDEATIKNMFNSFLVGLLNLADPQSHFNLKYVAAGLVEETEDDAPKPA